MPITDREFDLLLIAVKWKKRYIDSDPDVGMGPTMLNLVNEVCEAEVSFYVTPEERQSIAARL